MSRGGRHTHDYGVRVEKSYWLFDSESSYETDDCNRKRKRNKDDGPPQKKIKSGNVGNGDSNPPMNVNMPPSNATKSSTSSPSNTMECCECKHEVDGNKYVANELFDDIESVGSEYDGEQAFITELFSGIDDVASDITNVSEDEISFFPNIFNNFDDIPSDDDEDRVIITEIFDDTEIAIPDKCTNCSSDKNV